MLIMVRVLVFLGAIFALTSASALTFGANWHPQGEDTQAVANLMKSKNLRHLRFDAWFMPNNTPTPETIALATKMKANGLAMTAVITNPISRTIRNGYCPGDQQSIEAQAYNETYPQINGLKDLINDFELLNEPSLYPNTLIGGQKAPFVNAYSYNTQCSNTLAAVLRGMSRAVSDVGRNSGKKLRSLIGVTSDGSVGFLKLIQQKNVYFDIVGFHIYPDAGHQNIFTDTWYGPNGAMGLVKAFGKPVHINEFNCGETYKAGFNNQVGSALMNACVASLNKHINEIVSNPSQIEVVDFFELFDRGRPGVCATGNPYSGLSSDAECRFGLMYSMTSAKPSMDVVARFTGSAANGNLVVTPPVTPPVVNNNTPIVPQVPAGLPSNREYVLNLYRLLFGREPSTAEVDNWTKALDAGQATRDQIQKNLQSNIEFQNRIGGNNYSLPASLNGLSAYNYIDLLYKELQQRVASAGEINSWVAANQTKENLLKGFINSAEYKNKYAVVTNIVAPVVNGPAPTTNPTQVQVAPGLPNTRDYVINLYRLLFGREPGTGEVDSWAKALDAGQTNRVQMEKSMQASAEYRNRIGGNVYTIPASLQGLPAYNFIDLLYKELLQRVASAGEINSWVASNQPKENILKAFINSGEYKNIYGL